MTNLAEARAELAEAFEPNKREKREPSYDKVSF